MININSIKNILPDSIKRLGIEKELKITSVVLHWSDIVGKDIAKSSWPISLRQGVLLVVVRNSVWCHHLCMLKENLIKKINIFIGDNIVTDIKYKVGSIKDSKGILQEEDVHKPLMLPLDKAEIKQADELVKEIDDIKLRNKVLSVLLKDLAHKKYCKKENWHSCKTCGILVKAEECYCTVCEQENRRQRNADIRKYLLEVPWLNFAEFIKYYDCSKEEFQRVRTELVYRLLQEVRAGKGDQINELTLVMLLTGVSPFSISTEFIAKTLCKIRGGKYVSTPWS